MGLWGHVGELRRRLVRSLAALAAGLALVFLVRVQARWPYVGLDPYDNLAAQVFRQGAADLVPPDVGLIVTRPMDGFVAVFDVAILLAVLLTLPYVLAQVVGFLAPALRQRERRVLLALVVPAFLLFALGIAFGYRVVLPTAYRALYGFSAVLGAQTLLDVNEFVSFTLLFLLLCGAAFQTPLAMYGLARAGLVRPAVFLRKWRHAVVAIVVLAAVATPDPTPVSQLLVSGPLVALYFLGVALALPGWRAHQRTLRTPTPAAPGSGA
jgi:sec-independent protein translocase protein TatC